jgi:leader peptidase (prepilin peptidase) / N-methyltransferase
MTDFLSVLALGPYGRLVAGIWGALWGSFFNVLILRLPAGESLVQPASHCRRCGAPVRWYDNIPLLSYVILRGRCRRCKARFSARYLLVETLVCGLALLVHQLMVIDGSGELPLRLGQFVIGSLFCGLLVAVTFIDLDTLRIPDAITYPGMPLAAVASIFMGLSHLWDGAVGAVAGYLVIRLIADGYQLITGRMGMGYGDAKLLAMIGGLLGWQVLLPTLFLAALQGAVIGISALVIIRRRARPPDGAALEKPEAASESSTEAEGDAEEIDGEDDEPASASLRHARLPFGPFLSLAAVELLVLRPYLPLFFPYLY